MYLLPQVGSPFFPPQEVQDRGEALGGRISRWGVGSPTITRRPPGREAKEAKEKVDEAKVSPLCPVMVTPEGTAKEADNALAKEASAAGMAQTEAPEEESAVPDPLGNLAPFNRLRAKLDWWERHAPQFVLQLITQGVEPNFLGDHLVILFKRQKKSGEEIEKALEVMEEYVKLGAAKEVSWENTRYLVPWFLVTKTEGEKVKNRLISDCREINRGLHPPRFKLDHWKDIFPVLEPKMWAVKVDLQNAYFHLALSDAIKPFIRMEIGTKVFQMEGACFGLSTLPYLWMQVMHVFLKKWRKQGMLVFIYLDDILLLGKSKKLVQTHTHKS